MRMVISGLRFTLRNDRAHGLAVEVADEADPEIVLQIVTGFDGPLSETQFNDECTNWLNARSNEQIMHLRELARGRYRHQKHSYIHTTDFGADAEAKLDEIARISQRWDVYLGHKAATARIEGWFVFGPWLRDFCGQRFYQKPSRKRAIEFIDLAHAKVTANPEQARAYRSNTTADGASWVADREARSQGKTFKKVVDVASIGNGGHVVTWLDDDGVFHATEDNNNISFI